MSSAPPPHLDDEILSGLLDGEPEPAGAHLAGCADCRARQELLAEARLLVAAPTSGELDELTRRRLLSTALAAAPAPATVARPRWYRQPVLVGGIAAAVAAIVLAVPVINALNDGGSDEDASTAAPALSAEAPAAEGERSSLPTDLGDLGEIDVSVLRQQFSSVAADATTMNDSAEGVPMAPKAAQPAPPPQTATATGGDAGAGSEALREETTAASGGDTYDNRVGGAEPCVNAVLAGPAQGGQLRATATGTLRGTPVTVLVVDTDEGTMAFVAAREGCQVLETYTL